MESRPVTSSRSFLVIIIAIVILLAASAIYYILQQPETTSVSINNTKSINLIANNTVGLTHESGRISGTLEGPVVINITELP